MQTVNEMVKPINYSYLPSPRGHMSLSEFIKVISARIEFSSCNNIYSMFTVILSFIVIIWVFSTGGKPVYYNLFIYCEAFLTISLLIEIILYFLSTQQPITSPISILYISTGTLSLVCFLILWFHALREEYYEELLVPIVQLLRYTVPCLRFLVLLQNRDLVATGYDDISLDDSTRESLKL